ncbi:hypothetical protein D9M68_703110 [compost metagenome]
MTAYMPGRVSTSFEPPGPGTNSQAYRSPPPAMSMTAPLARSTFGDFIVIRFSGGDVNEPLEGLAPSLAFVGSFQCSLFDSVP